MKKIILLAIFVPVCFTFSSCYRKCKEVRHIERAYIMERYFRNYIPGAWWVYLNRDSTKRDSIWVDNFKTKTITDDINDCLSADEVSFDFHSMYYYFLFKPKKFIIGYNGSDVSQSQLYYEDSTGKQYPGFYATQNKPNFYEIGGIDYPVIQNYQLWSNNSNYIFPEVSVIGRIVVAPDFGIIQYAPTNSSDTFSLIKFHLP